MKKSRYTEEQSVGVLKESEAGLDTAELCRKHGISQQTFCRWKAKYGGLEVREAQRLRQLEEENRKLKAAGGRAGPGHRRLQGGAGKKVVGPQAEREAVKVFREATKCSERHACGQMEIVRAMVRYRARGSRYTEANERLRVRLRELAEKRRRWGLSAPARSAAGRLEGEQQARAPDLRGREAGGAATEAETPDLRTGAGAAGPAGASQRDMDDGLSAGHGP
jgi:putative transposase